MEFPAPDFKEPISTPPKLSLFSLPLKPPTLPDGVTPPPNTVATIPFLWEEVPGKPRPTTADDLTKSKTVRSLDLPPRLTTTTNAGGSNNNVRMEIIPSPTTVLGGPYEAKSLFESPEKLVVSNSNGETKEKSTMPLRKLMKKERSPVKFFSRRWDSFRDVDGGKFKVERSPSFNFCSWRWDSFRGSGGRSGRASICSSFDDGRDSVHKTGKVTRKDSFTFVNGTTSHFLVSMYSTLKQAIQRRSRK